MNKKNSIRALFYLTLFVSVLTSCEFKNRPGNNSRRKLRHDENYVRQVNNGIIKNYTFIGSVQRETLATIDSLQIKIRYGSPGVRKRPIWGKLVAYDSVWVSGANTATSMEFSRDVQLNGKTLKAGRYAFFTIPGRKVWTAIFNADYQQHNADDYDASKDVLRLELVPDTLLRPVQRLSYDIIRNEGRPAEISLTWEKLKIAFDVKRDSSGIKQGNAGKGKSGMIDKGNGS